MTDARTPPLPVTLAEFDRVFESVKNWGRWGPDDARGTLNFLTPERVAAAASLVRSGRTVSMAIPIDKTAGPDNPQPAYHFMTRMHDVPVSESGLSFGMCFLGMASHGDCHTHIDAPNHVAYRGQLYNGKPASTLTSLGSDWGGVDTYATGLVGRGVLLDAARHRGVAWLEPGDAVDREELEAIEKSQGVRLGEGDILVFRTGHHARRLALGAWSNDEPPVGEGKAGLAVDTVPWMHERRIAAFLPGWRRRDRPEQRRRHALPDPSPADGRDGHVHLRQPPARGAGGGMSARRGAGNSWSSVCRCGCRGPLGSPWNPIAIF